MKKKKPTIETMQNPTSACSYFMPISHFVTQNIKYRGIQRLRSNKISILKLNWLFFFFKLQVPGGEYDDYSLVPLPGCMLRHQQFYPSLLLHHQDKCQHICANNVLVFL